MSFLLASILTPLEDALHGLLFAIQRTTGLPWAWSIIVLTVIVRLAILPLAIIQMRSMRGMQKIAPELQKLKQKHKGDNQKLQAEMMALYRENNVNPVGSCLPLLFQLPVFMGLFFVLRGFAEHPPAGDLSFLGGFIPENADFAGIAEHVNEAGWAGWVLIVCYVGSQLASTLLMPVGADPQQQMMRRLFMVMPFIFVFFVIRFPVGLMLYWISTNLWTVGQQSTLRKLMGPPPNQPPPSAKREKKQRIPKPSGGKGLQGAGRSRRR
jgi:YidC/Oxa1 family membrane protein insertase